MLFGRQAILIWHNAVFTLNGPKHRRTLLAVVLREPGDRADADVDHFDLCARLFHALNNQFVGMNGPIELRIACGCVLTASSHSDRDRHKTRTHDKH